MSHHLDPLGIIASAVEQTKTPYGKGYASAFGGSERCPYAPTTLAARLWRKGFDAGRSERVRAPSES
jgi:hypothetical protein